MKNKYYIGLDVHKEQTTYAVRDRNGNIVAEGQAATKYADLQGLLQPYLKDSLIGVEASTSYYTLYRMFLKNNYRIKVANTIQLRPATAKNDVLDAQRLSDMLRLGTFPEAYIPPEDIQHLRSMVRVRHGIMEEKTRCNQRIQSLVDFNGLVMPPCGAFTKNWNHALMQHIGSGSASMELRHEWEHHKYLEGKQEQVDEEMKGYARKNWQKEYSILQSITGIGSIVACYAIANIHPITRFANKRKLRRYAGVVPTFQESADTKSVGKIPKGSSRELLRWALVQAANATAKTKTKLAKYYYKKKKQKRKTAAAKMAVASSLCDIIYEVMTTGKPYIAV